MTVSLCTAMAGCLLILVLSASSANAASGQITFSGAILEPTCSTSADAITSLPALHEQTSVRHSCGGVSSMADEGRYYALAVVNLDAPTAGRDPLLHYFAGYLNAGGGDGRAAELAVRTYE